MTAPSVPFRTHPSPTPGREGPTVREELGREVHRLFRVERRSKAAIGRELELGVKTVRRCLRQPAWRPYQRAAGQGEGEKAEAAIRYLGLRLS